MPSPSYQSKIIKHTVVEIAIAGSRIRTFYPTHSVTTDTIAEIGGDAIEITAICAIHSEISIGILLLERALVHECEALELILHRWAERRAIGIHTTRQRRRPRVQRRGIAIRQSIGKLRIEVAHVESVLEFRFERRLCHFLAESIPIHVSEEGMGHQLFRISFCS